MRARRGTAATLRAAVGDMVDAMYGNPGGDNPPGHRTAPSPLIACLLECGQERCLSPRPDPRKWAWGVRGGADAQSVGNRGAAKVTAGQRHQGFGTPVADARLLARVHNTCALIKIRRMIRCIGFSNAIRSNTLQNTLTLNTCRNTHRPTNTLRKYAPEPHAAATSIAISLISLL